MQSYTKLVLNLSCCQYKVVKEVGLDLNFKITSEKDSNNFDVFWADLGI
jgi:hypothetical protein